MIAVAVAPDGTWLATASGDGTARIWDAATGAARALIRVDAALEDCAWCLSGSTLAAVGNTGLYLFTFKP